MAPKKAVIFGASGLVGTNLLLALIRDKRYGLITIFLRKSMSTRHLKVKEIITDLTDENKIRESLQCDEIYCCLGSTIKKAGSEEAFRKVDFDLPVMIGKLAAEKNINSFLVISSLGADAKSSNFYLKTKGEMEQALMKMNLKNLKIFRPSMLLGPRSESRPMESIGKVVMKSLSFLFVGGLKKYKAIEASKVAEVMIFAANSDDSKMIYESDEIASSLVH